LATWIDAAQQNNLAVQQQRLAVEISTREVDKQRAGHYPTLDLVASSGRNSTLNSGAREITDADRIGLQLNIPIFEGGTVSSKQSEAAANRRAALSAQETARRGAILAARQAHIGVMNGLTQIKTMEAAHTAAKNALVSNKDAFGVGVRLGIDVLNAQNQVYVTHRDLTRVTVDTLMAQLRLKAAVGTLSEEDVLAVNGLLEK
jgi:outer membrane protein